MTEADEKLISEIIRAKVAEMVVVGALDKSVAQGSSLVDYLTEKLTQQAIYSQPEIYNQLVASTTLPMNEVAIQEAQTMAARQAATLVTNMAESELKSIGETVAQGLKDGKGPLDIARNLDAVKELDSGRAARLTKYMDDLSGMGMDQDEIKKAVEKRRKQLLKERKEVIAQTEAANAVEEGNYVQAVSGGKRFKFSMSVGDARVSEICQSCEAQGWIKINETFRSGALHPPHHPRCRCTVAYRENVDSFDKRRAQDRIDQTYNATQAAQTEKDAAKKKAESEKKVADIDKQIKAVDEGMKKLKSTQKELKSKVKAFDKKAEKKIDA